MILENLYSYNRFFLSCRRVKTDISPITLYCQDLFWEEGRYWILLGQGSPPNCTGKKEKIPENCTTLSFPPLQVLRQNISRRGAPAEAGLLSRGHPHWFPHHTMSENWLCSLFPCSSLFLHRVKCLQKSSPIYRLNMAPWFGTLVWWWEIYKLSE